MSSTKKTPAPPARDSIAQAFIKATDQRVRDTPKPETSAKPHTKERDKDKDKDKGKSKKKKDKKKEAVIIRFEDAQLQGIDTAAEALGLSRAAWVRMVVANALAVD